MFNSSDEISFVRLLESPPAGADKDSLVHEGGNRTGIAIFKNRRYLRKKSFFERFFAHKTGRDTKKYMSASVQWASRKLDSLHKRAEKTVQTSVKKNRMQFYGEFYLLLGGHHETNTEAFSKCLKKPHYPHFNSGFSNHLHSFTLGLFKCNIGTLVHACTQLPIICNSINAKCNSLIRLFKTVYCEPWHDWRGCPVWKQSQGRDHQRVAQWHCHRF